MTTSLRDGFTVDASSVRRTRDGYLAATPRVARVGIQEYLGSEVGRPDLQKVRVYRPRSEVMSADSRKTYAHKPVTNNHPPVPVTKENWKQFAVGHTSGEVWIDGDYIRVPMMVADAAAISDVDNGKIELSLGYSTDLDWTPGVLENGDTYDAVQRNIRANHLAIVKKARGGDKLKVGDAKEKPLAFHVDSVADCPKCGAKMSGGTCETCGYSVDAAPETDCPKCGAQMSGGTCSTCGYTRDDMPPWNPAAHPRVPAGSPAGGQFASKEEAQQFIEANRSRWKKARVEKVTEIRKEVPTGILALFKSKHKRKHERYVIKTDTASADAPGAADTLNEDAGRDDFTSKGEDAMAKITIDGVSCEMPDLSAQFVQRLMDQHVVKVKELTDKLTTDASYFENLKKENEKKKEETAAKDAEIATLKQQLVDAKPTAQALDAMVAERTSTITKAKSLLGDKLIVDGKTSAEIRRQVVDAAMKDAAKGWTDDQVTASFAVIGVGQQQQIAGTTVVPGVTDMSAGFAQPGPAALTDAAYKEYETKYLHGGRA